MKIFIISIGIPGSGKSTLAKFFKGAYVISADKLRMKDGKYRFRKKENPRIFAKCEELFLRAMEQKRKLIVLDNTNVFLAHTMFYEEEAKANGYMIFKIFLPCAIKESKKRNMHRVPLKAIQAMHGAMQDHFNYRMKHES